MCKATDLLGDNVEGSTLKQLAGPMELIDTQTTAIVTELVAELTVRAPRQHARFVFRYNELIYLVPLLLENLDKTLHTNVTTNVITAMRGESALALSRHNLPEIRTKLVQKDMFPPVGRMDESCMWQSILDDCALDSRKCLATLLFVLQLHECLQPCLLGVAKPLEISNLVAYHLDAYEPVAAWRGKLMKALASEHVTTHNGILNEAIYEISHLVRTMFFLPTSGTLRLSSVPDISHLAGQSGYSYNATAQAAAA